MREMLVKRGRGCVEVAVDLPLRWETVYVEERG